MTIAGECVRCSAPLRQGRRYCSQVCYRAARGPLEEDGKRTCRECGGRYEPASSARANWCPDCRSAYYRRYNQGKSHQQRERNLRKYGLTAGEYDALLAKQGGRCAICRNEPGDIRLAVDHDHATGQVRGLLCFDCNVGLGKFADNPHILNKAALYLQEASGRCLSPVPTSSTA